MIEKIVDLIWPGKNIEFEYSFRDEELPSIINTISQSARVMVEHWTVCEANNKGIDEEILIVECYGKRQAYESQSPDYIKIREFYEGLGAEPYGSELIQKLDGQREEFLDRYVPKYLLEVSIKRTHEFRKNLILEIGKMHESEDVPLTLKLWVELQKVYDLFSFFFTGELVVRESARDVMQRNLLESRREILDHVDNNKGFYADCMLNSFFELERYYIDNMISSEDDEPAGQKEG